jgi:predicted RNA binding protein YcfA (HicA-like mRNA interferase family)
MTRAPRLKGKELIKILQRHGFEVIRIKGSHHFLKNPAGQSTVGPVHSAETLGPGLLAKILRDCKLKIEDL